VVLQLLWVNLIMDTMGALALATEDPNPDLLNDKVCLRPSSPDRLTSRACSLMHC
jgi:magnesium-transporting ATPase (P-type)